MPLAILSATPRERPMILLQSKPRLSNLKPNSAARWLRVWKSSALRSRLLVGMQPQFRQVPPARSRSTTATFLPNCAARMAPT